MPDQAVDPRFAARMRELLKARGMSYRALAARVYQSKSVLHELASARRAPAPELARRIDDALNAAGELVGMIASVTEQGGVIDARPLVGNTDDVHRRTMIAALAGLGVGQAVDRLGIAALIASLADAQPDGATVDDWRETVREYGHTYLAAPRPELFADLAADLATVTVQTERTTDPKTAAGLDEAAALLAGLVAMVCTDLGYGREARHSWRLARRLADASGSTMARMWVRGQEAVLGLYSHRPLPLVLELADRGLAMGGSARAGVATLASARAQALAQLGRERDALEALHAVEDVFDRLPASVTGEADSIFGWPEHRLRHVESFVHGAVGRTAAAYRAQDDALALYPPSKAIGRSQVHMHRAACLIRDGEITAGLDYASTTLDGLPAYARGNFVLTMADVVLASVPARERSRPAATQYRHLLGSVRAGASPAVPDA